MILEENIDLDVRTLDDLIEELERYRKKYGGGVNETLGM